MDKRFIIGITGGSGMLYARRLIEQIEKAGAEMHIVISKASRQIIAHELGGPDEPIPEDSSAAMSYIPAENYKLHEPDNLAASISSGSYKVDGMVVVPCSMNTLGKVAAGISDNLICRAAGVMLKERHRLILVLRETPLSAIHLENMLRLSMAGAIILPACPGFYHLPETIDDIVDSIVGRILDHLEIPHDLNVRWSGD